MKRQTQEARTDENIRHSFSFRPVTKYHVIICILLVFAIFCGGIFFAARQMYEKAQYALSSTQAQIETRVNQSLGMLDDLARNPAYSDPSIPPMDKVATLDQISKQFGYLMVCFVDADINVYDTQGATSLAQRDYMQRLFSTGEAQVTDSFAAGSDGVTLNYTIAVPLFYNGEISGCLFCAIYFDEIVKLLQNGSFQGDVDTALLGMQGQSMSSTDSLHYGDSYAEMISDHHLFDTTQDQLEADFLDQSVKQNTFWNVGDGNLFYTVYGSIENTGWKLVCTTDLWHEFGVVFPIIGGMIAACALLLLILYLLTYRYYKSEIKAVEVLVQSMQSLEKKIYQDERPDDVDFKEIIRLTETGLSDGLTGVVTRTVFLNQLEAQVEKLSAEDTSALCFIDLDDLKMINDTYGHATGDIALKSIGYVLREYEKKYDGLVGRYGGDEFVLLLTGLDGIEELEGVLKELASRLCFDITSPDHRTLLIRCSVGVAMYRAGIQTDEWIAQADQALYFVKHNGKGHYKIYGG